MSEDKVLKEAEETVSKEMKKSSKETPDVAVYEAAAERIEAANKKTAELLAKQEALNIENTLGGEADAGSQEKTLEEKQEEAAKKFLEGTGLAEEAFPEKKA